MLLGTIPKSRQQSGGRGLVQCRQGGVSDADVHSFWHKYIQIFQNLWCAPQTRGEGSIFHEFEWMSFTEGPLF